MKKYVWQWSKVSGEEKAAVLQRIEDVIQEGRGRGREMAPGASWESGGRRSLGSVSHAQRIPQKKGPSPLMVFRLECGTFYS